MTPDSCPECGADLEPGAIVCPECGSCEETGWSEDAYGNRLSLPGGDFDYDRFIAEEFEEPSQQRRGIPTKWAVVAWTLIVILIGGLILLSVASR